MITPDKNQIRHIKNLVWLLCTLPLCRLLWLTIQQSLGANPIEFIEKSTGYWALCFLLCSLLPTPLRLISGIWWPIQLRRLLGLWMFTYACCHVLVYLWLDYGWNWMDITKDIGKHPFVLVGFLAFVLTIPLALTSNNSMIKRLGKRWKTLHQAVYFIALLAVTHFYWLVKKDIREPLYYAAILAILLGIRLYYKISLSITRRSSC